MKVKTWNTNHVFHGELQPPTDDIPINSHTGATIEVNPLAVATSQIAEQIRAPTLERGAFY